MNSLHLSPTEHRAFDPARDDNLYIDLEHLDAEVKVYPTIPGDVNRVTPIFIYAPLTVLQRHLFTIRTAFLDDIYTGLQTKPTPFMEHCRVCQLVQWLLVCNPSLEEALPPLMNEPPAIVFEVLREFFCRLRPKPLQFSKIHYKNSIRIDLCATAQRKFYDFPLPLSPNVYVNVGWPEGMKAIKSWTNAIKYLLHMDILGIQGHTMASTLSEVMVVIVMLMHDRTGVQGPYGRMPEHFLLASAWSLKPFNRLLFRLCVALGPTLCAFKGDWWREEFGIAEGEIEMNNNYYFALHKLMSNALMLDSFKVMGGKKLDFVADYEHKPDCETNPNSCWCYFMQELIISQGMQISNN